MCVTLKKDKMNMLLGSLVLMIIGLLSDSVWSFVLEGSSTSYAQFRKWNAALNGSLEFEFKTEQGNGLLLYTDDGGTYDFFEVKLVESALRLRYNLGGGAQIVTVGHDLGDGHWHKVQIVRNNENTTLTVDGVSATSTSRGKEYEFGRYNGNSDVYVGGMPSWYNSKLTLLALPSVIFEPRFNGLIRNLVYADDENLVPKRQEMKTRDAKVNRQLSKFILFMKFSFFLHFTSLLFIKDVVSHNFKVIRNLRSFRYDSVDRLHITFAKF